MGQGREKVSKHAEEPSGLSATAAVLSSVTEFVTRLAARDETGGAASSCQSPARKA